MPINYPSSLDDTTSLPNNRVNGDAIPITDNNDKADALIAIETKLGSGASTPTVDKVLIGTGSGTSAWQDLDALPLSGGIMTGEIYGDVSGNGQLSLFGSDKTGGAAGGDAVLAGGLSDSGTGGNVHLIPGNGGGGNGNVRVYDGDGLYYANLNAEPLTGSRTYDFVDASGTLALQVQAQDYEVTDTTKGLILKSPNGSRWRLTIDNSGLITTTSI